MYVEPHAGCRSETESSVECGARAAGPRRAGGDGTPPSDRVSPITMGTYGFKL